MKNCLLTAEKTGTFVSLAFIFLLLSCEREILLEECTFVKECAFDFTVSSILEPTSEIELTFNPKGNTQLVYNWNFGDGSFSDKINPIKKYSKPGQYNVILKISDETGSSTFKKNISWWKNNTTEKPGFVYTKTSATSNTYIFTVTGVEGEFSFIFGDGEEIITSKSEFTYTYPGPGKYQIILVSNEPDKALIISDLLDSDPINGG